MLASTDLRKIDELPVRSVFINGFDFTNYCFLKDARRIDTERAELEASGNVAALEDWECVQFEAVGDRFRHGAKVYDFLRIWEYNEETETIIRERKNMIAAKAVPQLVRSLSELDGIHPSVYVEWKTLVEQPRPLTESTWKALRPKLKDILWESDDWNLAESDARMQQMCFERLSELLIEIGGEHDLFKAIAITLGVDAVPTSAPVASTNHMYELV
ncbi:hypothetical protein FRC08_009881 [Ceratobasidium sp. 394]|nr:hypothetical protein FRC08_009881 [Ceratobasidium sp. 394]